MNSKKKNVTLPLILCIISSSIYLLILFFLAKLISKIITINILAFAIVFVCLTFSFFIFNSIYSGIIENKINKMNHQEAIDMLLNKKEWLKNNVLKVRELAITKIKKCLIYGIVSIILLNLSFLIACVAFNLYDYEEILILPLMSLSIFFPLLCIFFYKRFDSLINKDDDKVETKYKKINDFVSQLFKDEGITTPVKVELMFDVDCGISKQKDCLCIYIGIFCLRFLSNEEIKAILLHEIAHFKNKDLEYTSKIDKYNNILNALFPLKSYVFLCPFLATSAADNFLNDYLVNEYFEKKADEEVIKRNINQTYANAVAKGFGLSKANSLKYPNVEYEVSKNKKWDEKTINDDLNERLKYYDKHKDFFEFVSKHHADERFSTHPNVNQRRKMCNVDDVDLTITLNDYFNEDIKEYYELSNKTCFNTNDDYYVKQYNEYLTLKENNSDDVKELNKQLEMAYGIGDYENVLKTAYKLISLNDNRDRTNFYLGTILLDVYFNDEGIKYLDKVINNANNEFKVDAMQILGNYYVMVGNEAKLNEIRNIQVNIMNQNDEFDDALTLKPKDCLKEFNNDEVKNNVIDMLKDNEDVLCIMIGTKEVKDLSCTHVIVFTNYKRNDEEKFNDVMNEVFNYLDTLNDQYCLNAYPFAIIKNAKKLFKKSLIIYKK